MKKKIFSILLLAIMLLGMQSFCTFACNKLTLKELRAEKGAITIEAYNIGQGFLVEPSLFTKEENKSTGDITIELLESKNINYRGSSSYFSGFEFDDMAAPIYPEYLEPYVGELDSMGDGDGYLAEFDYSMYAGWCYSINDWWASLGIDSSFPGTEIIDYNTQETVLLGDVIRWHFTVFAYGSDCGFPSNVMAEYMGGNLFTQADKSELIFILAAINDYYGNLATDDVYETALAVAADPLATEEDIAEQEAILTSYIEDTFFSAKTENRITGYDGENVYFSFSEEGATVTVIFADFENHYLNNIKTEFKTTRKTNGESIMSVPVPEGIVLSQGDKIMLWGAVTSCSPICQEFFVTCD